MQFFSVFRDIAKVADFWCEMLISAELRVCVTWLYIYIYIYIYIYVTCYICCLILNLNISHIYMMIWYIYIYIYHIIIVGYMWQIFGRKSARHNFFTGCYKIEVKQIKWAIQIAKTIYSHLPCTFKKCKLHPKALLGVLIRRFLIGLCSSSFILLHCLWFFDW